MIRSKRSKFIAIPSFTGLSKEFKCRVGEIMYYLMSHGHGCLYIEHAGSPYIQHARNVLIKQFEDWGSEKILFIDDDVFASPEDILKLVETDKEIVIGAYREKCDEMQVNVKLMSNELIDGLYQLHSGPAGLMCIDRSVLDKIKSAFPENYYYVDDIKYYNFFAQGVYDIEQEDKSVKRVWVGEDFAFNMLCRESGVKMWLMPDITIDHVDRITNKKYSLCFNDIKKVE